MKKSFLLIVLVYGAVMSNFAQIKIPSPSPTQSFKQDFGLSTIEVSYSRPGVKDRVIFGDLVPYGKVWRTGANSATTISFGDEVTIGGKKIPAGKYGLLSIPGAAEWTIIITKQLDVTNPSAYKEDLDVVRVTANVEELPFSLETFTILISNISANTCELQLIWDKTVVTLPIKTEVDAKVMAQIDQAMKSGTKPPYYEAGFYYLNNGKDLNKALEWLNKATEANPTAYYMFYQKARCLQKLGRNPEAQTTAEKAISLARTANNSDYVALSEKLIKSLK